MKIAKKILAMALLAIAFVPQRANAQEAQTEEDIDAKYAVELVKAGTVAPDFSMATVGGDTLSLAQYKGKYVVLDFWASWCPDCRKDIPNVERMYSTYHDKGVEFVGISMDTDKTAWNNAIEKYAIKYAQASELVKFHDTKIAALYGVKWIPSLVLVDPEGKVVLSTVLSDKMEKKLASIFK